MPDCLRLTAVVALIAGCTGESNIRAAGDGVLGPRPDIVIEPPTLSFPRLDEGETATQTFTVYNRGLATLDVSAVEVVTSPEAYSVSGPSIFELEIDQSRTFEVTFTPTVEGDNFGRIELVSDDPDTARAPVDLLGGGSVPDLVITPKNFSFGEAFVPCGDEANLKLENVGSSDIVIDRIDYESSDGDMRLYELDDLIEDLPITLAPGETEFVEVRWRPQEAANDNGTLVVGSNDPVGDERAKQAGTGVFAGETTEVFDTPGVPPVDVMFLLDQSGSAGDDIDTLEAGMPAFFSRLRELADWQLVQINGRLGCRNGPIYTGATPSAESRFVASAFRPNHAFSTDEDAEMLFALAQLALEQTGPGQCNEGFLRPGALLHIIVASDEREQSGTPWTVHVANFQSFLADPDLLTISAVIDEFDVPCSSTGTGNDGYLQAAESTGGTVIDICTGQWGPELPDLATNAVSSVRSYNLGNRAVDGTIAVRVNGTPTTAFVYADDAKTVTVLDPPIGGGDQVTIDYTIGATCPE